MKITIHRGIDQIGGCITEISTNNTRILVDLGQNLPDGTGDVQDDFANKKTIQNLTDNIDAIFYTHYHGDHIGLFPYASSKIKQYIGEVAKQVVITKHKRLGYIKGREEISKKEVELLEQMIAFNPEDEIMVGDIKVTPYFVSHSAYDAYMFLIEADGKRILHTGDFRGHGYLSKGLLPTIEKLILPKGQIDFLITEGTMLSRMDERVRHENELKQEVIQLMKEYKYVFVICSSTDLERLATFYAANKGFRNRPFVCDDFQKDVLGIFTESAGKKSPLFNFDKPYSFHIDNYKLDNWMHDKGFCMLVRPTQKFERYLSHIKQTIDLNKAVLIYSMWGQYINPKSKHAVQRYLDFVKNFPNIEKLHTSGHASADVLAEVCNLVNPTSGIIPIHSEHSADYVKLPISHELKGRIMFNSGITGGTQVTIYGGYKIE